MSADRSRPIPFTFPVAESRLVVWLYELSLLLVLVAIFLLPFAAANVLSATLAATAGLLVLSGALATTLRARG